MSGWQILVLYLSGGVDVADKILDKKWNSSKSEQRSANWAPEDLICLFGPQLGNSCDQDANIWSSNPYRGPNDLKWPQITVVYQGYIGTIRLHRIVMSVSGTSGRLWNLNLLITSTVQMVNSSISILQTSNSFCCSFVSLFVASHAIFISFLNTEIVSIGVC